MTASTTTRPSPGLLPFLGRVVAAGVLASVATLAAWLLLRHTSLPAFTTSNVLRGLSTVATVAVVVVAVTVLAVLLRTRGGADLPRGRRVLLEVLCWLVPAGLVVAVIAVPLASTHLYLGGAGVDQAFRTQLLTRMTDTPGYGDMTYADLPGFYPKLWFLTGGIFAKLTGMAGWAAYQPWALVTLAAAGAVLVPVWQRITGSLLRGAAVALVSTAVMIAVAPEEPYSSVVALGLPAAVVLAGRAVRGRRAALVAVGLYLGLAANTYTLFAGLGALAVVLTALLAAWQDRRGGRTAVLAPLGRTVVTGVVSAVVALVGWAPYLWDALTADGVVRGKAQHYLPEAGTELPFPFLQVSLAGVLSVACLVWVVVRHRDRTAQAVGAGVAACYLWLLLSMLAPLAGTTLLGFRVHFPLELLLATGGVLAVADLYRDAWPRLADRVDADRLRSVTVVALVLTGVLVTAFVVRVPSEFRDHQDRALFDIAYSDPDGDGIRADGQAPEQSADFGEVDRVLRGALGEDRAAHVVLTDEPDMMSWYPYHGWQALTAHYANPLGRYDDRNAEIESWARATTPAELTAAMDRTAQDHGWAAPDALLLHGGLTERDGRQVVDGDLVFHMVDDIFPNEPNVRFRDVAFPGTAFDGPEWDLTQVDGIVVAVRHR